MVRNRGKKALYEVIGNSSYNSAKGRAVEKLHLEKADGQVQAEVDSSEEVVEQVLKWPKRAKSVQCYGGRIEMSIPLQVVIALALGLILAILAVFRLGQSYGQKTAAIVEKMPVKMQKAGKPNTVEAKKMPVKISDLPVVPSKGNNNIVIKQFGQRAHLEPARKYFASVGIATEIINRDNTYYLITKEKYENPERSGTNGHYAKKRIIEVGAGYKAPQGYETFGTKPFQDAYGKRF